MRLQRLLFNFNNAIEALLVNKVRAFLTSLGIIFGVAAVIAMLAIGNGAEKEILEQMKQVGSNNIVIKPVVKTKEEKQQQDDEGGKQNKYSPGISLQDAENIKHALSCVEGISTEAEMQTMFMMDGRKQGGKLVGVSNDYFKLLDMELESGEWFSSAQLDHAEPICIIGKKIAVKFFSASEAVGSKIKCGNNWLRVAGVLRAKGLNEAYAQKLSIRDADMEVYVPIKTFLLRYRNRGLVTIAAIKAASSRDDEDKKKIEEASNDNYNQLDRLVVKIASTDMVVPAVDVIHRMLLRRHNGVEDFEIIVPEMLLKQEQRTKQLFNTVLGIIASISLLVGGIGIMNIMLASVLERIKEIGLRLSLGASKRDILLQFVSESTVISVSGGVVGIFIGIGISYLIQFFTGIQTIISPLSVLLSFTISISVGLVFGIVPAKKAADQDPAESLRTG